jgi:hypothetical protein
MLKAALIVPGHGASAPQLEDLMPSAVADPALQVPLLTPSNLLKEPQQLDTGTAPVVLVDVVTEHKAMKFIARLMLYSMPLKVMSMELCSMVVLPFLLLLVEIGGKEKDVANASSLLLKLMYLETATQAQSL